MYCCFIFVVHGKNGLRCPPIGPEGFFPRNPDLADILGRTDLILRIFWTQHFWISKSPDLQISGFPSPQICKFPDFHVPKFPDFQTPPSPALDEFSDPNLNPLPTHPGIKIQIRCKEPLLRQQPLYPKMPCSYLHRNLPPPSQQTTRVEAVIQATYQVQFSFIEAS